ncbi:hypothetical protein GOBAR_DD27056 [Gossypium barbadense]|nr:hypothetical protein GOBAR_DD27056 [Gossypium barbadense]
MELHHHFSHQHPLEFMEEHNIKSEKANCSGCGEQVSGPSYSCTECEFYLDKKCFEASPEVNHPFHPKHSLKLLASPPYIGSWAICAFCDRRCENFVYHCSCKLDLHVKCALFSKTIAENKIGELEGVSQKDLLVSSENGSEELEETECFAFHESCISLQPIIKRFPRHGHSISHTFILGKYEIKSGKCKICHEEIFDDGSEEKGELLNNSAFDVIKEAKLGENDVIPTEIKHLSHPHNLIFSNDVKDDKYCDGCVLFISTSFYHCAQCDFFLHKSCAKLPKKMYDWNHIHQRPLTLDLQAVLLCRLCGFEFNNCFSYSCNVCKDHHTCVPCIKTSDTFTCQGHEHRLFFYEKYEGQCNGCGENLENAYACKECKFALEYNCLTLPDKIQHKCDEHPLMLTYVEDNIYSKYHYCDICERRRNASRWFYRCAICDNSAHTDCVIDAYSYMKLGKTYTAKDHPHPLTFTRKIYDYPPECHICEEHCEDLSAECLENGCNYIVHWKCIDPYREDILQWWRWQSRAED